MEVRGVLKVKAQNGKGFKVDGYDGWLNASDAVVPFLEKMEIGKEVTVTCEKKGVKVTVIKIVEASGAVKEEPKSTNAHVCTVCGKELKNPAFPTCWPCKDKVPKQAPATTSPQSYVGSSYTPSVDKTSQIQRGNALNAAGASLSGNLPGTQPADIAEALIIVAERALEWLRAE